MDYCKIGAFIANLRKEKNLTQKDLADILHVTDRAISKWERGKGCPDISLLDDLSKTLDVSILEILKGERIDKKEQIENNELIYSMSYAEKNFKEKVNNVVNIVSITIAIFISLLLLFYNIRICLFQKQPYYYNLFFAGDENLFTNVEHSINLIRSNQGKYSDDEYKTILSYIDNVKNIDNDKRLFNKNYYTFEDVKYVTSSDYQMEFNNLNITIIDSIYNILEKYNDDINYTGLYYDFSSSTRSLEIFINNFYKYNYVYEDDIYQNNKANYIRELIYHKYNHYYRILTYIVDGGDLSE